MVEADPAAAELLRHAQDRGAPNVELKRVRTGPEALEFLRQHAPYESVKRPHVLVTSISSDEEEAELLQTIRKDDTIQDIPVIVLTLRPNGDGMVDPVNVFGSLVVAKPMSFHDLVTLFREIENFFGDIVTLPGKPGRRW